MNADSIFISIGRGIGYAIGWLFMAGTQKALKAGTRGRSLPKPKASLTQEETEARIAGCREVVLAFATQVGYIAREVMSRDELEKLIDEGITADDLQNELNKRIDNHPGILLGDHNYHTHFYPAKQTPFYRQRHTYIIGKSGSGKTNLIRNMVLQDLEQGNGIGILAPEQEMLTEEILPYIPEERMDDVVYVNPADTDYPVPFNPLHLDTGENIDLRVDDTFTIFKRMMGDTGARMDEILRQSLYALMERPNSTLFDIERLLDRVDAGVRNEIIKTTSDPQTAHFFRDVYPGYPKDAHLPITSRISRLVRPKVVRNLLCQPGKSFNFREAMDEGKILLFNLSDGLLGEQTSQLLGQLIVSKLQMAVMSRADTPAKARRPFYLYLDEFQAFTGVNETSYDMLLSRARKYGLGLILAHQQTGQLSQNLLLEILGNVSTLIAFNVSYTDAKRLAHEYVLDTPGEAIPMPPEMLLKVKVGEAWAKIGKTVFPLKTALADQHPDLLRAKEVIERSRVNYGVRHVKEYVKSEKIPVKSEPLKEPGEEELDPSEVF